MDASFSNPAADAAAGATDYVRRLLMLLGDRDPLAVQRELVPWLRAAVDGLDERALRRPEGPGKWSILEVIRHLADSELVYRYRMRLIVAQPGAEVPAYDQDAWARRLRYDEDSVEGALEELAVLRDADLAWIAGLDDEELERSGVHAERGTESVRRIVRLLAAHDLVHRRQIERIKDALA